MILRQNFCGKSARQMHRCAFQFFAFGRGGLEVLLLMLPFLS